MSEAGRAAAALINAQLNAGQTVIFIPPDLAARLSESEAIEIARLCKLNGVELQVSD